MKKVWKWIITIKFETGMEITTEVKAESLKRAVNSIKYTAKKMNGEIIKIERGEQCETKD